MSEQSARSTAESEPVRTAPGGVPAALHRLALVAWGCLAYAVLALLGVAQLVQWGSSDVGWLVWWAASLTAALAGLVGCGAATVVLRAFLPAAPATDR